MNSKSSNVGSLPSLDWRLIILPKAYLFCRVARKSIVGALKPPKT